MSRAGLPARDERDEPSREISPADSVGTSSRTVSHGARVLDASRPDASLVSSAVSSAKRNMAAWLSLVPEADLVAVDSLFRDVRAADTNQDGKLDEAELRSLTAVDRATWMARVEYVGN